MSDRSESSGAAFAAFVASCLCTMLAASGPAFADPPGTSAQTASSQMAVAFHQDDAQGQMQVLIQGKETLVYRYSPELDMVHYYPLRSPSGKLLTVQQAEPYPHHRSFWFGDTVRLAGQAKPMSFYAPYYSHIDPKDPNSPHRDQIRHVRFTKQEVTPAGAVLAAELLWVADAGKTPMVDEARSMRIVPLGGGEYLLDCQFTIRATYGEITFASDATHYAWPYVRMHPQFAAQPTRIEKDSFGKPKTIVEKGAGVITNSEGEVGDKATCMKPARWVDYSAVVDGVTEGLTIFADPDQPPAKFFTRAYGAFGPRRPDEQSGKPFVLAKGESLKQRVAILVHSGDVHSGRVAQRYRQFADGKLLGIPK